MSLLYSLNSNMNKPMQVVLLTAFSLMVYAAPIRAQVQIFNPGDAGNPFPFGLAETFSKPSFADMDGDGDLDALSGSTNGTIVYLQNNGGNYVQLAGELNPLGFVALGEGMKSNVAVADLNGDGAPDVLVGDQLGILTYFENTGDAMNPAFGEGVENPFGLPDIGNNAAPYLVKFDGDEDYDLVTGEFAGVISYFENTGDVNSPSFIEHIGGGNPFNSIVVSATSQPALGDLDGDTDPDLVVGSVDGTLLYFENQGGTFVQLETNPFEGFQVTLDPNSLKGQSGPGIADIDGDTNNDVVVGNIMGDYWLIDTNGPLPVELTSFEVVRNGNEFTLTWTTASETNNAGFEVQHRIGSEFEQAGWVSGAGTTTSPQSYSFTVSGAGPGRHTFRLKQVDFDGAFAYGPQVDVVVTLNASHFASEVYPNPANPQATFSLVVARDQQVTVAVYDIQGRMVSLLHSGALDADRSYRFQLDASSWASGKYLIRAVGEAFETTRTVTILK